MNGECRKPFKADPTWIFFCFYLQRMSEKINILWSMLPTALCLHIYLYQYCTLQNKNKITMGPLLAKHKIIYYIVIILLCVQLHIMDPVIFFPFWSMLLQVTNYRISLKVLRVPQLEAIGIHSEYCKIRNLCQGLIFLIFASSAESRKSNLL